MPATMMLLAQQLIDTKLGDRPSQGLLCLFHQDSSACRAVMNHIDAPMVLPAKEFKTAEENSERKTSDACKEYFPFRPKKQEEGAGWAFDEFRRVPRGTGQEKEMKVGPVPPGRSIRPSLLASLYFRLVLLVFPNCLEARS